MKIKVKLPGYKILIVHEVIKNRNNSYTIEAFVRYRWIPWTFIHQLTTSENSLTEAVFVLTKRATERIMEDKKLYEELRNTKKQVKNLDCEAITMAQTLKETDL